jgi:phosphonate transport system substrate-binding protein
MPDACTGAHDLDSGYMHACRYSERNHSGYPGQVQPTVRSRRCTSIRWLGTLLLTPWLFIATAAASQPEASRDTYVFGVFPFLSPARVEAMYAPVSLEFAQALGKDIRLRTAPDMARFRIRMQQQLYDIVAVPPLLHVPAVEQFGYLPLARMEEPLQALIIVPETSALRQAEDLRGKTIATPPDFAPVTAMARKALRDQGMQPGTDVILEAFKSVDACFQQVLIGAADACAVPTFALNAIERRLRGPVRILVESAALPSASLVVHSRVPADEQAQLKQTILSWRDTHQGQALLRGLATRGFVSAEDAEYDPVRELLRERSEP